MARGWLTPALALLLVHAVLVQAVSYALRPAISYAILDLGHSSAWLGVATAAFAVPPLLLAVPSGRLTDRLGERVPLLMGACCFVGAVVVALLWGTTLVGLIVATVLLGLGVLWSVVGEQAWVMRDAPAGRLDAVFGIYTFATSSGQMLGPGLLALPNDASASPPFELIAWCCLGAAIAMLTLSFLIRSTTRVIIGEGDAPLERMLPAAWRLLRVRGVVPALLTSSLVLSSLDIALAYLPLLAQERMLAPWVLTALLVARGLATMLSRLSLGHLTRAFGRRRVLVVGGLASAVGLAALALPVDPWVLLLAMVVYGLAAGTAQPLTMSWMTLVTPRRDRGIGASMRLVGNRAGQTGIPLAVAGLSVLGGATVVFAATGASLVISAWLSRWAPNDDD
ncbi:MFS transporter [Agrococcus sp. ARC_14]|uniref:MFS transporter n=1 Tax=Agrococcus sp. ARC_14 TaxID=2919927 RepID=UPI001F05875B|nr:MFS transporter [Agrococcus sp. ARC_14]